MFIESRPVTGFGETAGWALPLMPQEPVPRVPLRRTPLLTSYSSTPSLAGMEQTIPPTLKQPPLTTNVKSSLQGHEQTIPPFRDFVKQTPPLEEDKPLPPTPLRVRGFSFGGTTNSSSREPSPSAPRRMSSVYSRTVSQWFSDSPTWSASDLADNPIPALPLEYLQPIAYSASTPQLKETAPVGPFLQPRTYQPLLTTPSPTASRCTSRSPSPTRASLRKDLRASVLLPTAVDVAQIPRTHLRTVSLEEAKANSSAPGAEHMLPEELRARSKVTSIPKVRSLEPIVKPPGPPVTRDTMAMFGRSVDLPPDAPGLPSMTLIDAEGRDRVVGTPRLSVAPSPTFAFPAEPILSPLYTLAAFPVGKNAPRTMTSQSEQIQQDASPYDSQRGHNVPDRGRTIQRGSRYSSFNQYQHDELRRRSSSSTNADEDAQRLAQDYHSMLAEQQRQASASSASRSITSDAEVGTHMKMVPRPLFNGKLSVIATGRDTRSSNRYDSGNASISPFHFHHHQQSDSSPSMRSETTSGSGYDYFPSPPRAPRPARLSTEAANRRRRSNMGMIPISPPFQYSLSPTTPTQMPPIPRPRNIPPHRRNSDDNRMSAYWHIPTKGGRSELLFRRSKEKNPSTSAAGASPQSPHSPKSPGLPLLGADIIAQRLQTPAATPENSPQVQEPWPIQQQQQQQYYHAGGPSRPTSAPSPSPMSCPDSRLGKEDEKNRRENPKAAKEVTAKQALFTRITKSAVKYADKLTRPAGYEPRSHGEEGERGRERERERPRYPPPHPPKDPNPPIIARKESPHLHHHPTTTSSSPTRRKQRPSHASKHNTSLGWTNAAKTAFDEQQEHLLLLREYQHQHQHPVQQQQQQQWQNNSVTSGGGGGGVQQDTYPRPMHQYQSQSQPPPPPQPPSLQPPPKNPTPHPPTTTARMRYTHTTTPARPLNNRTFSGSVSSGTYNHNLANNEQQQQVKSYSISSSSPFGSLAANNNPTNPNPSPRRTSNSSSLHLFSSTLPAFPAFLRNSKEARREARAEKRRGEIKRSIRVVGIGIEDEVGVGDA